MLHSNIFGQTMTRPVFGRGLVCPYRGSQRNCLDLVGLL